MKKIYPIIVLLTIAAYAHAQQEDHSGHDHAKGAVGHDAHEGHDHGAEEAADEHAGHDHGADESGHDDHEGHDHGAEEGGHDDHAGHDDHEGEGGMEISPEMAGKIGLKLNEASGGLISTTVAFPAEIKLNRDRSAAVSPRYSSVVRQVFVEIGDEVKKGDILASLENRDSMAVYTVSAPLDGVVVDKNTAVGEVADVGKELFKIADLSTVWADINIFPRFQHTIHKDMPVEFIAHDGHTAKGKVKYLSPLVSEETRTFTARCVLSGADEDFTPGAFVRARITTSSERVRIRVEREAVQMFEGEPVVFVPAEHGYESREVKTGKSEQHFIEITEGLQPGEQYVSAGAFSLKAEMVTSGMDPHAGHGH